MNFRSILSNILNKSPKIAMFIVILFLLGYQKSSYFGIEPKKNINSIDIPVDFLCNFYGAEVELEGDDDIFYDVIDKNSGDRVGGVISSINFSNKSQGYAGETPVLVLLDADNIITGVKLLNNKETRRFISRLSSSGFFDQWNGKHIADLDFRADAVSCATMSSSSIIFNVNSALSAVVGMHSFNKDITLSAYFGSFSILAIVSLAFLSYLFPAMMRRYRVILLIGSISILGIWQGAFVSLQLLYNWSIYGTTWSNFAIIILVLLAVLVPLISNKSFYCNYLCPFGALQELLGSVFKAKQSIPVVILKIFRYIRQFALLGIVALLFINEAFEPSSIEPFSIFMIQSATLSVIIISGISLVASLFINRPWCRMFCPTGEILSLLQRKIKYGTISSRRK